MAIEGISILGITSLGFNFLVIVVDVEVDRLVSITVGIDSSTIVVLS